MTSIAVYCIPLFWAWFLVVVAANILPSGDGWMDVMLLFIVVQSPDNHWTCHLSQSTNFCPWWQNPIFLWSQMAAFLEDCSAPTFVEGKIASKLPHFLWAASWKIWQGQPIGPVFDIVLFFLPCLCRISNFYPWALALSRPCRSGKDAKENHLQPRGFNQLTLAPGSIPAQIVEPVGDTVG